MNLVGDRYGRLVVTARAPTEGVCAIWICACDCGDVTTVRQQHLRSGRTTSCGCVVRTARGLSNTREYVCWRTMLSRCHDPSARNYDRYGGRGILVCQEWRESFLAFYDHIGPMPKHQRHEVDRIDNDRGYEPGNVRWQTHKQQSRHRSSNVLVEVDGQRMTFADAVDRFGAVSYETAWSRYRTYGWPIEKSLRVPARRKGATHAAHPLNV